MPNTPTFDHYKTLEKATAIFQQKGYHGTSMQDLVDVTGLNRSSIYNSFGNKLTLFMEVLNHYFKKIRKRIDAMIVHTYDAKDALNGIFEIYLEDIINDDHNKGCLIINTLGEMTNQEPVIASFMQHNQEQMIAWLEDIIYKGQMKGMINTLQTPTQYAFYLYSSLQGLRTIGILNKNQSDLSNITTTYLKVLE